MSRSILSRFDFSELLAYGIFLYICGVAGDRFDPRKVLTMAFCGIGVFYLLLSLAGFLEITWEPYFYFVFMFIGIFNSFILPSMIAVVGQWFPKKNRGLLVGAWASCNNFGNIVGIQLAATLLNTFSGRWEMLQVFAGGLVLLWAFVIFYFLVPHPDQLGMTIDEVI